MKKLTLLLLILATLPVFPGYFPDMDSLFLEANALYQEEKYEESINKYLQIREAGFESAELYFNTANAYFRSNKLGKARLFYERALLLNPADEDILANLSYTESFLSDRFEIVPEMFYKRWYRSVENAYDSDTWLILSLIFFGVFLFAAAAYVFLPRLNLKKAGFYGGVLFFLLTLFSFVFSVRRYHQQSNPGTAIVMDGSVTVKSSPRESGKDLFVLHEGTKVWMENEVDQWTEIRISDGRRGWLRKISLENI
ncbi:MAG: tetratricopeptide repeat protein [Bacteroidales bacterium]|nr:tetratricopeptide repeat protein [Bacteroidales bacterium]